MSGSPAEGLADQSPSTKLVFIVLTQEGSLIQQEISDESRLAVRTVRSPLSRLEAAGFIEEYCSVTDARQRIYALSTLGEAAAQPAPC